MSDLRRYRKANGLTLEQMGVKIGITKATVWKYENGVEIPAERVPEIEKATGIPRSKLRPDLWSRAPRASS